MKETETGKNRRNSTGRILLAFLAAACLLRIALPGLLQAEPLSPGPVVIINPFAPGGGTDIEVRNMIPYLQKHLGRPVIMQTMPGGGTTIATSAAAKAKPDGHTILIFVLPTASLSQELLNAKTDLVDFEFLYAWFEGANDLTVSGDSPYKTFQDLLDASKVKNLKVAISGIGSSAHLNSVLLEKFAGLKSTVVPYGGGGPAATALIRGDVDFYSGLSTTSIRFVKAGQMREIAILGPKRLEVFPDTSTIYELGYKDFPYIPFVRGIAAPPKTPPAVVATLVDALKKTVDDLGFRAIMKKQNRPVTPMSGAEMKKIAIDSFDIAKKYMPLMKGAAK